MRNVVPVLMKSEEFRQYIQQVLVGLNLFESSHGNAFNDGIRFAAKWIFDGIVLNPEVNEGERRVFAKELVDEYVAMKTEEMNGRANAWNAWAGDADDGGTGE